MSDIFKFTIAILTIIFSLGLIITGIVFQDMAVYKESQLAALYARRDDLAIQNQKIDVLIADLKSTIDQQNQINVDLSKKIDTLAALQTKGSQAPITSTTPTIKPVVTPTPTPTPTPSPPPVTAAS